MIAKLAKAGALDAYSYALKAVVETEMGSYAEATKSIREGIVAEAGNLAVSTAEAFLALKRGRDDSLGKIVSALQKDKAQKFETSYYLMALFNKLKDYPNGETAFRTAVIAEPASPDIYIESANQSLALAQRVKGADLDFQLELAKNFFEVATEARPESGHALGGLAITYVWMNKTTEALRYGDAAVRAEPNNAASHYARSAAYAARAKFVGSATKEAQAQQASLLDIAKESMNKASKLDKAALEGRPIPDALGVWKYLSTTGRIPVISAPR